MFLKEKNALVTIEILERQAYHSHAMHMRLQPVAGLVSLT